MKNKEFMSFDEKMAARLARKMKRFSEKPNGTHEHDMAIIQIFKLYNKVKESKNEKLIVYFTNQINQNDELKDTIEGIEEGEITKVTMREERYIKNNYPHFIRLYNIVKEHKDDVNSKTRLNLMRLAHTYNKIAKKVNNYITSCALEMLCDCEHKMSEICELFNIDYDGREWGGTCEFVDTNKIRYAA